MELFKKIAEVLAQGEHLNISVAKAKGADDKMTVYVTINGDNLTDEVNGAIPPILLKGTPDELDRGFIDAILTPVEEVVGLHVNWRQFNAAKDALAKDLADKEAKAKDDKKAAPAAKKPSKTKKAETPATEEPEEKNEQTTAEEAPAQSADVAADMPDYSEKAGDSPVEQEAPAQQEPVEEQKPEKKEEQKAPEAADVVKEDLNTLWKKGRRLFDEGKYDAALEAYQQCRMVAPEKLYGTIDKAIAVCNNRRQTPLFNE